MTDRATVTARIIAVLTALAITAVCTACAHLQPAPHQSTVATKLRPSSPLAPAPAASAPRLAALLPASLDWIEAAAGLAARFAAAYATCAFDQPPGAWLARLRPMTTSQLYRVVAQAAETPGILAQRDRTRLSVAATVTAEQIRDLTAGSMIIVVQVREAITSTAGYSRASEDLAVTVIEAGGGQAVYDVEPAAACNTGGDADGPLAP